MNAVMTKIGLPESLNQKIRFALVTGEPNL